MLEVDTGQHTPEHLDQGWSELDLGLGLPRRLAELGPSGSQMSLEVEAEMVAGIPDQLL